MNYMYNDECYKRHSEHCGSKCNGCHNNRCRCHDNCYQNCNPSCYNNCNQSSRCNFGSIGNVSITLTAPILTQPLNLPIVNITADTRHLNCSSLRLDFLGNLTLQASVAPTTVTLTYTLFKTCRGDFFRQPVSTFSSTTSILVINTPQIQALNFQGFSSLCSCDSCCNYTLELTNISSTVAATINVSLSGTLCIQPLQGCCR